MRAERKLEHHWGCCWRQGWVGDKEVEMKTVYLTNSSENAPWIDVTHLIFSFNHFSPPPNNNDNNRQHVIHYSMPAHVSEGFDRAQLGKNRFSQIYLWYSLSHLTLKLDRRIIWLSRIPHTITIAYQWSNTIEPLGIYTLAQEQVGIHQIKNPTHFMLFINLPSA